MNPIKALLNPTSVAVVGASADPTKLNGRPITYLKRHGFKGQIFPINPRYDADRWAKMLCRCQRSADCT